MGRACPQGYTRDEISEMLDPLYEDFFWSWMTGQTMSLCDGRTYRHDRSHGDWCEYGKNCGPQIDEYGYGYKCDYTGTGEYLDSMCKDNPHGIVVYTWDFERYLAGLPVID